MLLRDHDVSVFIVFGREIFELFGITLSAFRIAGRILVFMVGFHLLQGQESGVDSPTAEDNEGSRDWAFDLADRSAHPSTANAQALEAIGMIPGRKHLVLEGRASEE